MLAGHTPHVDEPSAAAYVPVPQSVHDATFEAVENLPAAHAAHELAPALVPVFVIEPAAHTMQSAAFVDPLPATYLPAPHAVHDESVDAVEYLPAAHVVHIVAPAIGPVFVTDPVPHSLHELLAEVVEYLPAAHAMHAVAAAFVPVSVMDPALHGEQ